MDAYAPGEAGAGHQKARSAACSPRGVWGRTRPGRQLRTPTLSAPVPGLGLVGRVRADGPLPCSRRTASVK